MVRLRTVFIGVLCSMAMVSCGGSAVEVVKADSTITSASVGTIQGPDPINTDTTTVAPTPMVDSAALKKADSLKAHAAQPKKEVKTTPAKPKDIKKVTKKADPPKKQPAKK